MKTWWNKSPFTSIQFNFRSRKCEVLSGRIVDGDDDCPFIVLTKFSIALPFSEIHWKESSLFFIFFLVYFFLYCASYIMK